MSNELIYGRDATTRVVSLEVGETDVTLFRELEDGTIETEVRPFKSYILYTEQHSPKFRQLAGNQAYGWIYEADSLTKYKEILYSSGQKKYDMHVVRDLKEQVMLKEGITYFKGMKVEDVSVLSFDIETTGVVHNEASKVLLISNTFRRKGKITRRLFSLDEHIDQKTMINEWCRWVRIMNPSIVLGHNIFGFDLPYLKYVADMAKTTLDLGRDESEIKFNSRASQFRKDGSQSYEYHNAYIYGREVIDTYFLSIKHDIARNYESYGLKQIIKQEGLERPGRTHYDASKITQDWPDVTKREEIKKYAIDDADDALKILDLMIPSFFYLAQSIPRSPQHIINSATGGWINGFMIRSYLQNGDSIARASELPEHTEGGISFAVPGMYRNLYKVDLKSAYPSQVLRFKLYDKQKDPKAHFLKMVEFFAEARFELKRLYKETKEKYHKDRDGSAKVFLNSAYGVTITRGLNYNSPAIGAKITLETRNVIDTTLLFISGKDRTHWMNKFKEAVGKLDEAV